MIVTLELGLAGSDLVAIGRALLDAGLTGPGTPTGLSIDGRARKPTEDWLETATAACRNYVMARWGKDGWLRVDRDRLVKISRPGYDLAPRKLLNLLSSIPFTVGSTPSLHPEWTNGALGEEYLAPSFAELHWGHGWACFFRGAGHDHLVSRRWPDFGPWRVLRGANDTTLVQFHDLEADARTALTQAKPGHERMGISDIGGYIQTRYQYAYELRGLYYAEQRKMHIVAHGREVTQREMLDACATRRYQALGADQPLDNVVYVFVEEGPARAHLHELWLRGLECRTFIEGREVRLDADYRPPPTKPEWVRQVEERERADKSE